MKQCRVCEVELTNDNWPLWLQRGVGRICRDCNNKRTREYNVEYLQLPYVKARKKAYSQTPKFKNQQRAYLVTPSGVFTHLKSHAKKRNILVEFSRKQFTEWYSFQPKKCNYCLIPIDLAVRPEWYSQANMPCYRLSVDRKDSKKSYSLDNITLACGLCQNIKGYYWTEIEFKEIALKYIKPKWKEFSQIL